MKKVLSIILVLSMVFTLAACGGKNNNTSNLDNMTLDEALEAMETRELKWGVSWGSSHSAMEYMNYFANLIKERSKGKIVITLYPDESLVKNNDIYQSLLDGIIDIGEADPSYSFASFPLASAYFLPGMPYANSTVATYVATEWFQSDFEEMKAAHHLFGIGMTPSGIMSKTKIEKLSDFKGVQIRAAGYPAKAINALGATAVGITPPECYEGLLKNTIQAVFMPDEALKNWNFAEVVGYSTTIPGIATQCHFVAMNNDVYNSFPKPVREMIDACAADTEAKIAPMWDEMSKQAREYAKSKGVDVYDVTEENRAEMMKALESVQKEWLEEKKAAGLDGQKAIDHLLELIEKYNKLYQ